MSEDEEKVKVSLSAIESLALRSSNNIDEQEYRTKFMRDSDRILYSKAFRRLAGKTQVYLAQTDDHKRTRLTHTLEVAQIAKTISTALQLDLHLTEAIALGHDIGHTPFGHAGERMLHQLMKPLDTSGKILTGIEKYSIKDSPIKTYELSGFKHNFQSIRAAVDLEKMYTDVGLDLTNFTLYGMLNHSKLRYNKDSSNNDLGYYDKYNNVYLLSNSNKAWSFEAFVVSESDEIAQRHHDIEDAIQGKIITESEICGIIENHFSKFLSEQEKNNLKELKTSKDEYFSAGLSRIIVNLLVVRLIKYSIKNLNNIINDNKLNEGIKNIMKFIFESDDLQVKNTISYDIVGENEFLLALESFENDIVNRVISSYEIQKMDAKGQYVIRKLFEAFYNNPQQLPNNPIIAFMKDKGTFGNREKINESIEERGIGYIRKGFSELITKRNPDYDTHLMRVICDHISGMTDSYALNIYEQLY